MVMQLLNHSLNTLSLKFFSVSLEDLILLCETLKTMLSFADLSYPFYYIKENIEESIDYIVESINCEFLVKDSFVYIVSKDASISEAVEQIHDEETALNLIEYNRVLFKGDITEKKRILLQLGQFIEPILKSKTLSNNGYSNIANDLGFYLNNFNIRHNNLEGKNSKQFCIDINNNSELEEWYDATYNTLIMAIIATKQIELHEKVTQLKKL
ncbi:MAG: hypothetical protein R3Y35_14200 [Clostridia bacterium]